MATKARLWLASGVRLVWTVWPARRQVDVWDVLTPQTPRTLESTDELHGGEVLAGFTYPLEQLWK